MPIQSDDIKLLRSQVMADVPEGGGAMTGVEIVDGLSNNVFPDSSTGDRATGRIQMRKLFGVAHSDDTDTALDASFAVLLPPEDPLVHVTCFETDGWADELTTAQDAIERYLVKGSKLIARIQDVHYAGALLLELYNISPATGFPEPGETIVVRNPNGDEQYIRVLSTVLDTVQAVVGGAVSTLTTCKCTLAKELDFDLLGAPIQLNTPSATSFAFVYSTTPTVGTKFHGVKKLGVAATIGDKFVSVQDGIFTPLVPAATTSVAVTDVYPLAERSTLAGFATADMPLPARSVTLSPGTVLSLPTAISHNTLVMTHGGTSFVDNGAGELLQGSTVVGDVDHRGKTITMLGTAPSYGTASNQITYKPATVVGATAHSGGRSITQTNQSLTYVEVLEPIPAAGTLTVSYMAQGRWYDLAEDGTGKLSGSSSEYGVGTLNFLTGSLALSLGALPDAGSMIVMTWGEASSVITATPRPSRSQCWLALDKQPEPGTLSIVWPVAIGVDKVATVDAAGVVTGEAQIGEVELVPGGGYQVLFSPDVLPLGPVTVSYTASAENAAFTNDGGGNYTLSGAPILPGSLRFQILATASGGGTKVYSCYSRGTVVYAGSEVIGTVNNTTGALSLSGSASINITTYKSVLYKTSYETQSEWTPGLGFPPLVKVPHYKKVAEVTSYTYGKASIIQFGYLPATGGAAESQQIVPDWFIDLDPPVGLEMITNGLAFGLGGRVHFAVDGALFYDYYAVGGVATSVGSATSEGLISVNSVAGGQPNAITWYNAALDARGGLDVVAGLFRVPSAPLASGNFQLQNGPLLASANSGDILGGDFEGRVDAQRGIVYWQVDGLTPTNTNVTPVRADTLTYNAVYLQYVPLDESLLGLSTARLPLDGKVPIYRAGDQVVVHNTLETVLPNPLTKDTAYNLGRQRISAVNVKTVAGVKVPGNLYSMDFSAGEITFPLAADLTGYDQPFTVSHRIEDEVLTQKADISGVLDFVSGLTHNFPANTSYVSSKLRQGDLFARTFLSIEQTTWTGEWSDELIGSAPVWNYNDIDYPWAMTNRGAITERWAIIFVTTTTVRVIGEKVGQVLDGVSIASEIAPINPQTGVPYFSIPALGWGTGQSVGNVVRRNTAAAGAPAWFARTILQGASAVTSDAATIAYRMDVDTP